MEEHIKFESLINKSVNPSSCWEWGGATNKDGYGLFYIKGKKERLAHRIAYSIYKGEFPNELFICHHCDNPSCVNPDHLFAGTQKDNMKDMVSKKRWRGRNPGEYCRRGHKFDKSVITNRNYCKQCISESNKKWFLKHREEDNIRRKLLYDRTYVSLARKDLETHCKNGHFFKEETVYVNKKGSRECKICRRISGKKSYANKIFGKK